MEYLSDHFVIGVYWHFCWLSGVADSPDAICWNKLKTFSRNLGKYLWNIPAVSFWASYPNYCVGMVFCEVWHTDFSLRCSQEGLLWVSSLTTASIWTVPLLPPCQIESWKCPILFLCMGCLMGVGIHFGDVPDRNKKLLKAAY